MSDADWWAFSRLGDRYVADLGVVERAVLADLTDQVVELLGGEPGVTGGDDEPGALDPMTTTQFESGPVDVPSDPALHRLLPDGSRADHDVAAEYRRLTETDLRATKIGNLRRLRAALRGEPVEVGAEQAPAVAAALTDIRLVVAERMGVRTDADADAVTALLMAGDAPADPEDADPEDADPEDADPEDVDPEHDATLYLATVSTMLGALLESLVELMLDELA